MKKTWKRKNSLSPARLRPPSGAGEPGRRKGGSFPFFCKPAAELKIIAPPPYKAIEGPVSA